MGTVGTVWVLWGYSEAFGPDLGAGLLGNPTKHFGLNGVMNAIYGFVPAANGAAAPVASPGRRSSPSRWSSRSSPSPWSPAPSPTGRSSPPGPSSPSSGRRLVYFPAAHWVFAFSGYAAPGRRLDRQQGDGLFLGGVGAYDFAGGTAIHINAGVAGLALALVLGKRIGFEKDPMRPHNLTLVMIGAGILWFGWFGFNAGSALGAGAQAAGVWVNTLAATCTAMLGWLLTEKIRDGHFTSLGAASGIVAGLVAITPACATVSPIGALWVGLLAGVGCALAVGLKFRFGFDDSLDVVGVHLVGGLIGTLLIGLFADAKGSPTGAAGLSMNDGLFYGGGFAQLGAQAEGAFAVLLFSFVVTFAIGWVLHKTMGFRISEDDEVGGIDLAEHAETGYDLASFGGSRSGSSFGHGLLHQSATSAPREPLVEAPEKEGASA